MSEVNESVHVITFDPELTENQQKSMDVLARAAVLSGRMEECSLTIELLDNLADQFADKSVEGEEADINHMFVAFCSMIGETLSEHLEEMFEQSKEIGVNSDE